jgi:hypothetical protein
VYEEGKLLVRPKGMKGGRKGGTKGGRKGTNDEND